MLKIVCISDSHGQHRDLQIPDGDILIHAGDLTNFGEIEMLKDFNAMLGDLPHRHKIVIAGNHDSCCEFEPEKCRAILSHGIYLQDELLEIEGLKIYGSPWQPNHFDMAFNLQRGREIRKKWLQIPRGVDVLVTHGPPRGHGDDLGYGNLTGCEDLLDVVSLLRPKYHIFGHVHGGYGLSKNAYTTFINASVCDENDAVVNAPIVIEYEM